MDDYLYDLDRFCKELTYEDLDLINKINDLAKSKQLTIKNRNYLKKKFEQKEFQEAIVKTFRLLLFYEESKKMLLEKKYEVLNTETFDDWTQIMYFDLTWALYRCDEMYKTAIRWVLFGKTTGRKESNYE